MKGNWYFLFLASSHGRAITHSYKKHVEIKELGLIIKVTRRTGKFCSRLHEISVIILTRAREGGGADFALPSCFSGISWKLNAWFLRAFQYLPKNEQQNFWKIDWKSIDNFGREGGGRCKVKKKRSSRPYWRASCRHAELSVWIIYRGRETKRCRETGKAAFESSLQDTPNSCLSF